MSMQAETLINDCPFCHSSEVDMNSALDGKQNWVYCNQCEAEGPVKGSEADAIYMWNYPTHTLDLLNKDAERLRRELDEAQGVIR